MRVKARRFLSSEKVRAGYKKEEKFITIEEEISLEEDDLIDTCKEEEEDGRK